MGRPKASKGYEVGNIQWVSVAANYAKHAWPEEVLIKFCEAVVSHQEEL